MADMGLKRGLSLQKPSVGYLRKASSLQTANAAVDDNAGKHILHARDGRENMNARRLIFV